MTINQLVGWCVTESVYQSADQSFCQFVSQSASDSVSLSACRSADYYDRASVNCFHSWPLIPLDRQNLPLFTWWSCDSISILNPTVVSVSSLVSLGFSSWSGLCTSR